MFKAETSNPKIFKTVFSTISSIIDEVELKADNEGIRLNTIDRERFTFISLEMTPHLFDEYVCDEPVTMSFDVFEFMKAMKLVSTDDRLILSCDNYKLTLTFEGIYQSKFEIGFIDIIRDNPHPPELSYDVELEIESKTLNEMLNKLSKISGKEVAGTIEIDQDNFKVYSANHLIKSDFSYLHGEKVDDNIKTTFTLERMINILKASSLTDITELKLSNDHPINIIFKPQAEDFTLEFILAPRIENEEE